MASQQPVGNFPSRPYTSGLGRPGSTAPQNTYNNAPQSTAYQSQAYNQAGAFGAATQQQREAARLERERIERAERERKDDEERRVLDDISEEQKEEISEAVSYATDLISGRNIGADTAS